MVEPRAGLREPDQAPEDAAARVGGEGDDEVPEEPLPGRDVVERREAVHLHEEVVDEPRDLHEEVPALLRDHDVLGTELDELLRVLQGGAVDVRRVSKRPRGLDGEPDLPGPKVREDEVRHVEPRRAVLEDVDPVLRAEEPLLHRLRRLRAGDHPLYALHPGRHRGHPEAGHRVVEDFPQGDPLPHRPHPGLRVGAALRAPREEPPLLAPGADPEPDLDFDRLLRDGLVHEPLHPARSPQGEEGVRGRGHLPGRRLLGPPHPGADPRRAPGPHRNPHILRRELDTVRRLGGGAGAQSLRRAVDPEPRQQRPPVELDDELPVPESVGRPEDDERVLRRRVEREDEGVPAEPPGPCDGIPERVERGDVEVVPEEVVPRMEGDAVLPGELEGVLPRRGFPARGQLPRRGPELLPVPLDREGAGDEGMVVLQELAVRNEDLPEVRDPLDLRPRLPGLGLRRDRDEVPVLQEDERALDRLARADGARLPGALRLDLRAHGDELVEDDHRRGMEAEGGEPVRAALPVPEAEPARAARVAQDGPAGEDVLDERLVRL